MKPYRCDHRVRIPVHLCYFQVADWKKGGTFQIRDDTFVNPLNFLQVCVDLNEAVLLDCICQY